MTHTQGQANNKARVNHVCVCKCMFYEVIGDAYSVNTNVCVLNLNQQLVVSPLTSKKNVATYIENTSLVTKALCCVCVCGGVLNPSLHFES